jgi:hypothetical protein
MRVLLIAAAAFATFLAGFAPSASAEPPAAVSIQLHPINFAPETGNWEASGAISDSGSFERPFLQAAPPDAPPFALVPFRETFVLSGAHGTLTINDESRNTADGVTGVWQIASGTGDYADASGHGTLAFFVLPGPIFTLALTGVAST